MRRKLFLIAAALAVLLNLTVSMGIVPENYQAEKIIKDGKKLYTGKIEKIEKADKGLKLKIKLNEYDGICMLLSYYKEIEYADELYRRQISFVTTPVKPDVRRNPGCFDYRKYLKSEGIWITGTTEKITVLPGNGSLADRFIRKLNIYKGDFLQQISDGNRGIIAGILFGDTEFLDEKTYEDFRNNGTAHVLAVSGLHIGILYSFFTKISGNRRGLVHLVCLSSLLFTAGTLASWSPSVIRAVGVIFLRTISRYLDLPFDFLSATSAVMILLMLNNPFVVCSTGFQMSFLAAASISFFMPHMPKKIPDGAAVMLSANIGMVPYQMYVFNSFSFTSFFANIPVVYLVGIMMPVAAVAFILFCMGIDITLINDINEALAFVTVRVNEFSAMGGKGAIDVVSPDAGVMAFIFLSLFFISSEQFTIFKLRNRKMSIAAVISGFIILSAVAGTIAYEPVSQDDIVFVDVGQGDCVHIRDGRRNILIDAGGNMNYQVGKNTVKPYLLKNGCLKADMAIASHLHTDHYRGIEELDSENMIKTVKTGLTAGEKIIISDNVKIETLWPLEIIDGQDENENCSVFMIYYKKYKILITGDLDIKGEKAMMNRYSGSQKLKADILKIGHHGSSFSTGDEFLKEVRPSVCVIQVGKNNYGHPDSKVIEKCRENGIMVLRNDICGAVGFSFGDTIRFHTMIRDKG